MTNTAAYQESATTGSKTAAAQGHASGQEILLLQQREITECGVKLGKSEAFSCSAEINSQLQILGQTG